MAFAWAEVKKLYPSANYTIYERETEHGLVNYFTDGKTCWVKTGVTIEGVEHIEQLPVMDFKNKSIPLNNVTSFEVNKSIQRSLTKAIARHGLGLYIYAGEDLPEDGDGVPNHTTSSEAPTGDAMSLAKEVAKYMKEYNSQFSTLIKLTMQEYGVARVTELPIEALQSLVQSAKDGANTFKK